MASADRSERAPDFQVLLLGPFALYRRGELLDTASWQRSALTLLKLLATGFEQRRLRDELIDVLWPDALPETGANNLRYVLSVVRRNLGGGDPTPVLSERGWISLNSSYSWEIDLVRFETSLEGEERGREQLEETLRLYRGEPLADERYDDWAAPVRDRIHRLWRAACLKLAGVLQDVGSTETGLQWLERLLAEDPLDEEALRSLLKGLATMDRRAEALKRFQQFEKRLRSELDVAPSDETIEVVAGLKAGTAASRGPSPRSLSDSPSKSERATPPAGAYLGSLPSAPLVDRQEELNRALEQIEAVAQGEGRLLMLAGEPGVGKTRFAQELTRILLDRGFILAAGRCYEMEQTEAYYPFLDALSAVYRAAPQSIQSESTERWPYLGRLLPDYVPSILAKGTPSDEQQLLFRAVTGFLEAVARVAPIALMLDDLHWSDAGSLRLFLHICRHTRKTPLLLLSTYRNVEVGRHHPLERALLDLGREGLVERFVLRRLVREDTAALIAGTLGGADLAPELIDLVHGPTEGNPFFVQQVVRSMVERGELQGENGRWRRRNLGQIEVPESVRAAIGQRLSGLKPETQEILREASILGQTFLFDDLQGVGCRSEEKTESALEEARDHGLIQLLGVDAYGFDHALTRQAVLGELSPRKRRKLHVAAAHALVLQATLSGGKERRAAEIASHFLEGDDEEQALPWTLLAGDRAEAVYAHDGAERHYRTALEVATEIHDRAREAEALVKLGEVLIVVSRHKEALPLEERAAEIYRSQGDLLGEAQAETRIAWVYAGMGIPDKATDRLSATIAKLETVGPSRELVDLYAALVGQLGVARRGSDALAAAQRLEVLAREVGYERYVAFAPTVRAYHLLEHGQIEEGLDVLERALTPMEAAGDLYSLGGTVANIGRLHALRGDLPRARECMERHRSIQIRRGDPTAIANALSDLFWISFQQGDWSQAAELLQQALDLVRDRIDQPFTAIPMSALGYSQILTGDDEGAVTHLERSITIAGSLPGVAYYAHVGLALRDLLRGRPEDARRRLEQVLYSEDYPRPLQTIGLPTLAEACLTVGDLDRAAEVLSQARSRAEKEHNRLAQVEILLIEGMLLARRGEPVLAGQALDEALALAREIGLSFQEARILEAQGALSRQQGEPVVARRRFGEAMEMYERLGARPFAERSERALADLADPRVPRSG